MRKSLDFLYRASGAVAALFLVAICVAVLLQVGANLLAAVVKAITGRPTGFVIPSYAEFTGFFLAATSFLALAYTLRHGAHIRVGLLLHRLPARARRWAELWCSVGGAAISGYFAVYSALLVAESWRYADLSSGMVPVPLWLPQSSMAVGLTVLAIALLDDAVAVLRGRTPTYEAGESETAAVLAGHDR